jgi:hypothetical protein
VSLVDHSVREANVALRDDRMAHLTHLAIPADKLTGALIQLHRWQLPALRSLELRYPTLSIVELASTLQQAQLPSLELLTVGSCMHEHPHSTPAAVWHGLAQLPLIERLRGLSIAPLSAILSTPSELATRWVELVSHMPQLTHLDLRWATLSQPAMERLIRTPRFVHLDALDLVSTSNAADLTLHAAPALPAPRALALRNVQLDRLLDTPLFSRIEELELWLQAPAQDLRALEAHPRWAHLTSLSLDMRSFKPGMLFAITPPPKLRALRIAWHNHQRALSPDELAAVARWSGLHLLPSIRAPRAALLTDLEPLRV